MACSDEKWRPNWSISKVTLCDSTWLHRRDLRERRDALMLFRAKLALHPREMCEQKATKTSYFLKTANHMVRLYHLAKTAGRCNPRATATNSEKLIRSVFNRKCTKIYMNRGTENINTYYCWMGTWKVEVQARRVRKIRVTCKKHCLSHWCALLWDASPHQMNAETLPAKPRTLSKFCIRCQNPWWKPQLSTNKCNGKRC
jgi:hypothetical protein